MQGGMHQHLSSPPGTRTAPSSALGSPTRGPLPFSLASGHCTSAPPCRHGSTALRFPSFAKRVHIRRARVPWSVLAVGLVRPSVHACHIIMPLRTTTNVLLASCGKHSCFLRRNGKHSSVARQARRGGISCLVATSRRHGRINVSPAAMTTQQARFSPQKCLDLTPNLRV